MLDKMSESQRVMLQAAAKRGDRLLTPPAKVRAAAVKTLAGKLVDAGWAKEIKARNGAPVWSKDATSGETYALKLTAKGFKAAAASTDEPADAQEASASYAQEDTEHQAPVKRPASRREKSVQMPSDVRSEGSPLEIRALRPDSKIGRVLSMLACENGATIGELTAATGWLEHTTRAALTGLRHRGYTLSLARKERDGASVYRTVARGEEAAT